MSGRHFDTDPFTGITQRFHWNDDGTFTLEATQDVEGLVEEAKTRFNNHTGGKWNPLGEHVGFIPNVFLEQMMRDGSIRDPKAVLGFLEANPLLKTRPGSLL